MERWPARYADPYYEEETWIENHACLHSPDTALRMTLGGVTFQGLAPDDWEAATPEAAALARDHLPASIREGREGAVELQGYTLETAIPALLIGAAGGGEVPAKLRLILHRPETPEGERPAPTTCSLFQLEAPGEVFRCDSPHPSFEDSLLQLCGQIRGRYLLKNCFGCLFSDYSPYGSGDFGSMLCFRGVAEEYLRVSGKTGDDRGASIWTVHQQGRQRQETFLCAQFQPRVRCLGGYRGLIYGE